MVKFIRRNSGETFFKGIVSAGASLLDALVNVLSLGLYYGNFEYQWMKSNVYKKEKDNV